MARAYAGRHARSKISAMATRRVVLTYEDYRAMPDDGRRYEILEGEVAVTATPAVAHQLIVGNLYWMLRGHVQTRSLGQVYLSPLTVILADTTVAEPDLVYVDRSRAGLVTDRGIHGAPTLAVEVHSPSTASTDRGPKFQLYARYGIPPATGSPTRRRTCSTASSWMRASTAWSPGCKVMGCACSRHFPT
jgi:Uma2 family endonuclease